METELGNLVSVDIKTGIPANIQRNSEPTAVSRPIDLLIYFVVSDPGLTPGMYAQR